MYYTIFYKLLNSEVLNSAIKYVWVKDCSITVKILNKLCSLNGFITLFYINLVVKIML